ncbi:hypothetical protein TRSC58_04017 [Trypanosoma rangeli SC58]|uniref:Uncharacterized protein n=1 Tax=Trypanosoma rangeli SC58 TaxID=429131 RepID=A0A061J4P4_TRYRA|nr:hypothetical protein TRSC58_04017 [Trypanosoma rangeli SC58]
MNRMLVIQMLHSKAMERRMMAECDVVSAEEMGFRELIILEEGFRWEEMFNWAEMEVYQLKVALAEQEMLNRFRFDVVGSFGLDKLAEKEMTLHSSIMGLQNRLDQAEKDLKTFNFRHTEFLQEKRQRWNNEKEALDLQMEELRIRITRLNQGPDAVAPTKSPKSGVMDVTKSRTETPTEGIHISYLTERTKEALSRAQDIFL